MTMIGTSPPAPPPELPDQYEQAVRTGIESFHALRRENDQLLGELRSSNATAREWERIALLSQREAETLRQINTDIQRRLEFYMRYGAEIATEVQAVHDIAGKALQKAKDNSYRPAGPRPPANEPGNDIAPVDAALIGLKAVAEACDPKTMPQFLTDRYNAQNAFWQKSSE